MDNLPHTYDHARAYYRWRRANLEMLLASPVKIRIGEFNQPVLGDRIWGTYNVFPNLWQENSLDAYALRREQNRSGDLPAARRRLAPIGSPSTPMDSASPVRCSSA
jgi:hypothetical protein